MQSVILRQFNSIYLIKLDNKEKTDFFKSNSDELNQIYNEIKLPLKLHGVDHDFTKNYYNYNIDMKSTYPYNFHYVKLPKQKLILN